MNQHYQARLARQRAKTEARDRRLALAERQRLRALDTARHAVQWLELDKGPGEKEPGEAPWRYDLNEALALLRTASQHVESALENA